MAKKDSIKNLWTIICKRAIVDEQTNLATLVDLVEKLGLDIDISQAPKEIQDSYKNGKLSTPFQIPDPLTIASYWLFDDALLGKDLVLETRIKDQDGKILLEGNAGIRAEKERNLHRTFVNLVGFPVTGTGVYTIESTITDLKGKEISRGEVSLTVELNKVSLP